jgi:reverse gyrase
MRAYRRDFAFIFVDDVDSFLKTAKNIDKALYLLNFSPEDIELALKLIRLKEKLNKSRGGLAGNKKTLRAGCQSIPKEKGRPCGVLRHL